MEIDENGQEHFRKGSKIGNDWEAYHAWQDDSVEAEADYKATLRQLPRRPRENLTAGYGGRRHGLPGNYTLDERKYQTLQLLHVIAVDSVSSVTNRIELSRSRPSSPGR
jgi:hypothetical protein